MFCFKFSSVNILEYLQLLIPVLPLAFEIEIVVRFYVAGTEDIFMF